MNFMGIPDRKIWCAPFFYGFCLSDALNGLHLFLLPVVHDEDVITMACQCPKRAKFISTLYETEQTGTDFCVSMP